VARLRTARGGMQSAVGSAVLLGLLWAGPCYGYEAWTVTVAVDDAGPLATSAAEKVARLAGAAEGERVVCATLGAGLGSGIAAKLLRVQEIVAQGARKAGDGPLLVGLCGHGTGALGGVAGLLAEPDGGGATIAQVAEALGAGLRAGGREQADLIVLEMCRTASLEVAVELAPYAKQCALVAGDLVLPGLCWAQTVESAAGGPSVASGWIVGQLAGNRAQAGTGRAGIVLVDLGAARRLTAALASTVQAAETDRSTVYWALGDLWGRRSPKEVQGVSVARLAARLAGVAPEGPVRVAAESLGGATREAQVGTWRLGGETWWTPELTLYVPAPFGGSLDAYEQACGLSRSSGYSRLLRAYEEHCLRSLPVRCH